ncbi:MAG TPA: spore protease YyaC [Bacillales bacterium]|nr:spore protease YyaC [Bacillales bacterium]
MNLKRKIVPTKPYLHKVHFQEESAVAMLSKHIGNRLPSIQKQTVAVVCIGTDRSTGDALGPIVGSKLKQKAPSSIEVYGTLEEPVHAVNLEKELQQIYTSHHDPFIIGVDASLGKSENIGMISFGEGPVKPGAGVKKQLPPVGHAHITGIVNVSGFMEYFVLQNTRLNLVMQMAEAIADSLYSASFQEKPRLSIRASYQ